MHFLTQSILILYFFESFVRLWFGLLQNSCYLCLQL